MIRTYISYRVSFRVYFILLMLLIVAKFAQAQVPVNEGKQSSETIIAMAERSENNDFTIGILGNDYNLFKNIERAASLHQSSKTIEIEQLNSLEDIKDCDIIYITDDRVAEINAETIRSVITISKTNKTDYMLAYNNGKMDILMNKRTQNQFLGAN